jgi:hypothetical protein
MIAAASQLACDQPRWRHLGSRIVSLQPSGEDAHHTETRRPRIVVGLAERRLPMQKEIDRDVIGTLAISEHGEAAQHPGRERQIEPEAPAHGEIVVETLCQGGHARPP